MVVLTPLGLLAPGGAFGEQAPVDLNLRSYHLQSVPSGLNDYNGFWTHTVLGGYGFGAGQHEYLSYILSALVGILAVGAGVFALVSLLRALARRQPELGAEGAEAHAL
jgi:cobalt/nickel transport system permease protein